MESEKLTINYHPDYCPYCRNFGAVSVPTDRFLAVCYGGTFARIVNMDEAQLEPCGFFDPKPECEKGFKLVPNWRKIIYWAVAVLLGVAFWLWFGLVVLR